MGLSADAICTTSSLARGLPVAYSEWQHISCQELKVKVVVGVEMFEVWPECCG